MLSPHGGGNATLTDRDGQRPIGPIAPGVEVTISAWLPHREGTRYLVSKGVGADLGWLQTTALQAQPRPVTPKPLVAVVEKPKPKPRVRKMPLTGVAKNVPLAAVVAKKAPQTAVAKVAPVAKAAPAAVAAKTRPVAAAAVAKRR